MKKNRSMITLHPNKKLTVISMIAGLILLILGTVYYFLFGRYNFALAMITIITYAIVFGYFTALRAPIFFSRIRLYDESVSEIGVFTVRAKMRSYLIRDFGIGLCQNPKMYKKWIYVSTYKLTDDQKQHMEYFDNSDDFIKLRYSEEYHKLLSDYLDNCGVIL